MKCGVCIEERAKFVDLLPTGVCPECSADYSQEQVKYGGKKMIATQKSVPVEQRPFSDAAALLLDRYDKAAAKLRAAIATPYSGMGDPKHVTDLANNLVGVVEDMNLLWQVELKTRPKNA